MSSKKYQKDFKRNINIFIRHMTNNKTSIKNKNYEIIIISNKKREHYTDFFSLLVFFSLSIYLLFEWQPIVFFLSFFLFSFFLYSIILSKKDEKKALLSIDFKSRRINYKHMHNNYKSKEIAFEKLKNMTINQNEITYNRITTYCVDLIVHTNDDKTNTVFTFFFEFEREAIKGANNILLFFEKTILTHLNLPSDRSHYFNK